MRYIEKFVQQSVLVIVITLLALIAMWIHESYKVHEYTTAWIHSRIESKQQLALLSAEAAVFTSHDSMQMADAARRYCSFAASHSRLATVTNI